MAGKFATYEDFQNSERFVQVDYYVKSDAIIITTLPSMMLEQNDFSGELFHSLSNRPIDEFELGVDQARVENLYKTDSSYDYLITGSIIDYEIWGSQTRARAEHIALKAHAQILDMLKQEQSLISKTLANASNMTITRR